MPTNWETADVLKTPMEITWQFDYEIDIEKLRSLYSKAKQRQWDAERDIDWERPVDPSKPIIDDEMKMVIRRALNEQSLRDENSELRKRLDMRFGYDAIIGRDHRM